jgi:hypothetical protein
MPRRFRWDLLLLALGALLFVQIWRVQDLLPSLAVSGLPIAATLAALLLYGLDSDPDRNLSILRRPICGIGLALLVLVTLSIPGSLYPGWSLDFLLKDFLRSIILMILIAASIRGLADVERFAWLQLGGATLLCTVVLLRFEVDTDGRLGYLPYFDSNDLGMVIVCTLPLTVYLYRRTGSLAGRLVVLGVSACLLLVLVRTGSRGGFLGLIGVVAYGVLGFHAVPLAKRLGAVALAGTLFVGLSNDRYWQMMQTILHPSADYNWSGNSETGRMEVWKRGIGYMVKHPVLGVGARAFGVAEGTLSPEVAARQGYGIGFKWSEAHNAFVEIGAELGVPGLVLFVALLIAGFRTLARVGRGPPSHAAFLAQALSASLVGYVVTGFFLSQAYSPYLYTLLAMSAGLERVAGRVQATPPWSTGYRSSVFGARGPQRMPASPA